MFRSSPSSLASSLPFPLGASGSRLRVPGRSGLPWPRRLSSPLARLQRPLGASPLPLPGRLCSSPIGATSRHGDGAEGRRGNSGEARDSAAVALALAEEDRADLGGTRLSALVGHDVAQVGDGGGAEAAFARAELKVPLAKAFEEGFEVLSGIPPGVAVNDDVVDVADQSCAGR
ncbi:hypothetical protein ACSSS7_006755 [Eimeria intestinalis]